LKSIYFSLAILASFVSQAQEPDEIRSFFASDSVRVTIDKPGGFSRKKPVVITFFALPNGNTTEQTMGRKLKPGDDWHFDIQHIRAQTKFIRSHLKGKNFVVIYLENHYRSWPMWKQKHPDFAARIPALVDSLERLVPGRKKEVYLNGHSGGGSFIFGYLAGLERIPGKVKRISFLDSDYGYDSSYYPKFRDWLQRVRGAALNVFAYNDSVALLNGKPFVSATGGTWYRSRLFLQHLQKDFSMQNTEDDSLVIYKSTAGNVQFFLKTNPDRKIFHTVQVELNGFIHSIFCGTPLDSKDYRYYANRAYAELIDESEIVLQTH
jgi:pimeloyl-ACP methyl ester carboxylesterase